MSLIETYWFEIIVGAVSILIGILVSFVSYKLQKREISSGDIERRKRAREELLDVIEGNIINRQNLTEDMIQDLIAASERMYKVNLVEVSNPIILLQDVLLRLQRSKHLDINQKGVYNDQIENLIHILKNKDMVYPMGTKALFDKLEEAISNKQLEEANSYASTLRKEFYKNQLSQNGNEKFLELFIGKASAIMGILASMITILISTIGRDEKTELFAPLSVLALIIILIGVLIKSYMSRQIAKKELINIDDHFNR